MPDLREVAKNSPFVPERQLAAASGKCSDFFFHTSLSSTVSCFVMVQAMLMSAVSLAP